MTFSAHQDFFNMAAFFASVLGLYLLFNDRSQPMSADSENPDALLMAMSFSYWVVYCVALNAQKWVTPDWEIVLLSLKFTTVLSYLLTFSCMLSLPLNRLAARQQQT